VTGLEREPRYALYKTSIDLFIKNPLLGVGPWSFRYIYYEEYAEKYKGVRLKLVPHSGILGLLAEFGFFAFVFFAGYVIVTTYIFRKAAGLAASLNKPKEHIAVLTVEAGFWAFFIFGVFQEIAGSRFFYVFPAIGAAMYYRLLALAEEEGEAVENPPAVADF
jgi:O-antigen ligase